MERTEVEKLVETRLKEDGREKVLEKRVSKLIDDNSLSLSTVQQELDARKRETQVRTCLLTCTIVSAICEDTVIVCN